MKAEQDGLERRLWAKQERLKAEHEKSLSAEKDMCVRAMCVESGADTQSKDNTETCPAGPTSGT
jgi:hypothetical protein